MLSAAAQLQHHPLAPLGVAVLDLEMTGLEDDAHIVEAAVWHFELGDLHGLPRLAFHSLVRPERDIHPGAHKVHGLTLDRAADGVVLPSGIVQTSLAEAPLLQDVAEDLLAALQGRLVATYSSPADFVWLRANLQRIGRSADCPAWPWFDVFSEAACVDGDRRVRGPRTLFASAQRRGIVLEGAHRAIADAGAAALLMLDLLRAELERANRDLVGKSILLERAESVETYMRHHGDRAIARERDFADYVRRAHGHRAARPACPWHELQGVELPDWSQSPIVGRCPVCLHEATFHVQGAQLVCLRPDGTPHVCPQATPPSEGSGWADPVPHSNDDIPF